MPHTHPKNKKIKNVIADDSKGTLDSLVRRLVTATYRGFVPISHSLLGPCYVNIFSTMKMFNSLESYQFSVFTSHLKE